MTTLDTAMRNCVLCNDPNMETIHEELLTPGGMTRVASALSEADSSVTYSAWMSRVERHRSDHMPKAMHVALTEGGDLAVDRGQRILASLEYGLSLSVEALKRTNARAKKLTEDRGPEDRAATAQAESAVTKNIMALSKIAEVYAGINEKGEAVRRMTVDVAMPAYESLIDELAATRQRQLAAQDAGLITLGEEDFSEVEAEAVRVGNIGTTD